LVRTFFYTEATFLPIFSSQG